MFDLLQLCLNPNQTRRCFSVPGRVALLTTPQTVHLLATILNINYLISIPYLGESKQHANSNYHLTLFTCYLICFLKHLRGGEGALNKRTTPASAKHMHAFYINNSFCLHVLAVCDTFLGLFLLVNCQPSENHTFFLDFFFFFIF